MRPLDALPRLDPREGEGRLSSVALLLGALGVAVALIVVAAVVWSDEELPASVTIAAGPATSAYHALGRGIAGTVQGAGVGFEATVLTTSGSATNVLLVEEGEADLGFVHDRPPKTPFSSLRTVARLYQDVLQVIVREGSGISAPADLDGRTIGLGPCRSAERRVAESVLAQYGVDPEPWPDCSLPPTKRLRAGPFPPETLLAEALLGGLPTAAVAERLEAPGAKLLSLGDSRAGASSLEGLGLALDGIRPTRIPARTYGRWPAAPVVTVGVDVLLVARADLPETVVSEVTRLLFENRFLLSEFHPAAAQLQEVGPEARFRFPLHPGAATYYGRDRPHPLVEWAEPLSLALALLAAAVSGLLTLRQWLRRRKKNRIDVYYLELERLSDELLAAETKESIRAIETRLLRLRRRAFRELVAERLEADESFAIFESSLSHRLAETSQRLRDGGPLVAS